MKYLLIFLQTRSKKLLSGILLILCALILWEILCVYSADYSVTEIRVYKGLSIILFLFGSGMIILHLKTKRLRKMKFSEKEEISPYFSLTYSFLHTITGYFMSAEITENMPIQKYVTQIYKNILDLHKRRLDRCQVQLEWKSVPRIYTDHAYKKRTYFEGKYEITEIEQQIESRRRYSMNHHTILLCNDMELAHITEINAKKAGDNDIICPNCGCTTTRENLIDGCDYCGTRFTVEDLGKKISNFTLRDDADLAYKKFKDGRLDRGFHAFVIIFWVLFAFMVVIMMLLMTGDSASGDPINPLFLTFSTVSVSISFAYIFAFCLMTFYLFVIFPVTEIFTNVRYHSRKKAENLRDHRKQDEIFQKKIQEKDPLFSLTGFYSNIQNKLNTIFYAETREQLNAFSAIDLGSYHNLYRNIIDFDIEEMNLLDYHLENGLQIADININVYLYELVPVSHKVIFKKQHIKIQAVKSINAKTPAVSTPYILLCPNCGHSLSLQNGMICSYCGTKPDLKEYDWTICEYLVL